VARRAHDAPLLGGVNAGRSTAKGRAAAAAHFHKHHRAVACAHNQVDFAASTPRRLIIACQQAQTGGLQMRQRTFFGGAPARTGALRWRHPPEKKTATTPASPMLPSFAAALPAAAAACAVQHHPAGALYLVATPIGNLADISLRALHVLHIADCIACEDTRRTQALLRSYGMARANGQLLAVHQHNEAAAAAAIVARLHRGQRVAYASDAGTPAISDPGARLAATVRQAGLRAIPLPGASSITAALSVAGAVASGEAESGFVFAGFLPAKSAARQAALHRLAQDGRCTVLLEAPHRIAHLAADLAPLGARPVTLAREISKQFEEIDTLPASALSAWLHAAPQRAKGEFVVVLHPLAQSPKAKALDDAALRVLRLLLAQTLPLKTAVRLAWEISGAPRKALYAAALDMQKQTVD